MKRVFLGVPRKFSLDALYPPAGLLYLAAAVRRLGHAVRLVDGQIEGEEALLREFAGGGYDVFGTTVLSPLRESSYALIRKIKEIAPSCLAVAGGAHVSLLPEQTMRHVPEIDVVVVGEGEQTLADILSGRDLAEIPGLWFRREGRLVSTGLREPMDPALIPMPAWDLIDITRYRAYEDVVVDGVSWADRPFLTVYSSRGCTGSCSFCSTWRIWRKWRQVPPERFADEIELLYRRGIVHFFIADDSMINDEEFVRRFADEVVRRELDIRYKIACRADRITPAVARDLKRSGCYEVHIGFESGSRKILEAMGKRLSVEDNLRAATLVREAEMRVYALIVIGAVGETVETINETIGFLERIRPDVVATMGGLMLLPGTRDYARAVAEGLVSDDFWLGDGTFPYYTKSFSREELSLLTLAVRKGRRLWPRALFHPQMMLSFPEEYARLVNCRPSVRRLLSRYAGVKRRLGRPITRREGSHETR